MQRNDVRTQNEGKELAGLCCVGMSGDWREVHMKKTGFLNPFLVRTCTKYGFRPFLRQILMHMNDKAL